MRKKFEKKSLKSTQVKPILYAFQKTGLGTPALAGEGKFDGTITDNGVGDYTITLNVPLKRSPIANVGVKTANTIAQVSAITNSSVRVKTFQGNDGTTAQEADFDLIIFGFETPDVV